ncbi:MAG: hypothetical protein MJ130_03365 [Lachnospiraceae bacterium]|nr:hypothetical protein [Lachnospiraceae bacterium]
MNSEIYNRIKKEYEEDFTKAANEGKPLTISESMYIGMKYLDEKETEPWMCDKFVELLSELENDNEPELVQAVLQAVREVKRMADE